MPTLTEDAFRRRELASAGIEAEVDTDGHHAVVRLTVHALDKLIAGHVVPQDRLDAQYDAGREDGYSEGYTDGGKDGRRRALNEVRALAGKPAEPAEGALL